MNVVPLFNDKKKSIKIWHDTIHWWLDPSIKIRFVESGDKYWFIMGAESSKNDSNIIFFKELTKSENYERFKKGHGGEAYLRLGIYSEKDKSSKSASVCNCGHESEDHDDEGCLYEDCKCKKFQTFQLNLLKRKKTVTDILFIDEKDVKTDSLCWNCLYTHKYSKISD